MVAPAAPPAVDTAKHPVIRGKAGMQELSCETRERRAANRGATFWPAMFFLIFFAILVVFVSHYYLIPALTAKQSATQPATNRLEAQAALILTILLVMLLSGLILIFKVHRFFLPGERQPRVKTKYVDAWAEAGKRAGE
jgi:type II secretory pathway component PulF